MEHNERYQRLLLIVPLITLLSTIYVACSDADSVSDPTRAEDDAGSTDVDALPDNSVTTWPDVAEDDSEAPISGAG